LADGGVLSGPGGGVAGSVYAARLLGEPSLIPLDMGGTSTDISLIVDGAAALAANRRVGSHRIALNSLDIASIGAGGGSIARVDTGGILHVGPESAGAVPGPACYGQGGTDATVTDANLVLGYLDPGNFLGGDRKLEAEAAAPISATGARSTAPRSSASSRRWKPRRCGDCAPPSTDRSAPPARSTCAMASRCSRSPCRSTRWTGRPPTRCCRSSSCFTAA